MYHRSARRRHSLSKRTLARASALSSALNCFVPKADLYQGPLTTVLTNPGWRGRHVCPVVIFLAVEAWVPAEEVKDAYRPPGKSPRREESAQDSGARLRRGEVRLGAGQAQRQAAALAHCGNTGIACIRLSAPGQLLSSCGLSTRPFPGARGHAPPILRERRAIDQASPNPRHGGIVRLVGFFVPRVIPCSTVQQPRRLP
jgi:hypothetical protein